MYWLSYVVIAVIVGGLLAAYKTEVYLTQILLIQNLIIFMMVNIPSIRYPALGYTVISDLAGKPIYLQTGENLHTFLTLMYLHVDFMHIIGNMLILFFIGVALEDRIGKKRVALIYFPAGLLATLGQYSLSWGANTFNLGASGAIMALMGAIVLLYPKDKIPMFLGPIFMPEVRVDLAVVVFVAMQSGIALLTPNSTVAHAAHFTGFAAGMLFALAIKRYYPEDNKEETFDYKKLKPLATTPELNRIYSEIENADSQEVRNAWIEHFLNKTECPKCGRKLNGSKCRCGFKIQQD